MFIVFINNNHSKFLFLQQTPEPFVSTSSSSSSSFTNPSSPETTMQRSATISSMNSNPKRSPELSHSSSKQIKVSREEEEDEEVGEVIGEEEEDNVSANVRMNSREGVQRYLVSVEYVGTRFFGSQKQPNCRTVVGVLEEAFQKFVGQPMPIYCSSRIDAGVHALSNVCHVDVERTSKRQPGEILPPHAPDVVQRAVNHFLQKNDSDIMVVDVRCVPPYFHARFNAQERTYFYRLLSGRQPLSVFEKERAWHISEELDIHAMQEACKILVGCHDFSSFRAAGCQAKSPIRTLVELHISEVTPSPCFPSITDREMLNSSREPLSCNMMETVGRQTYLKKCDGVVFGQRHSHRCFIITARARSFLYHQVRLLVGVLKAVGTGNLTTTDVKRILDAKTVTASSPMAPACGLYLGNVKYDLP